MDIVLPAWWVLFPTQQSPDIQQQGEALELEKDE